MDKNRFKWEYAAYEKICKEIERAYDADDKEALEAARSELRMFDGDIAKKGNRYANVFFLYKKSRDNMNERLDIDDVVHDGDVPDLIESFRDFGITEFTFSSRWSSTVQTAWLFVENGCELKGIEQINHGDPKWDECKKIPAYVFTVN